MLTIMTTPRTMSAWLSNLLTIPHQSLYVHDPAMEPGLIDAVKAADIPRKGLVMTAGAEPLQWEPEVPDMAIVDGAEAVYSRVRQMMGVDLAENAVRAHQRLVESGAEVYWIENIDDWIAAVYERCTGAAFDPIRYAALKNLRIESQFAAGIRAGRYQDGGLAPLAAALGVQSEDVA